MNHQTEEQIRKYIKGREKQLRTQQLRKAKKKKKVISPIDRIRQKNWIGIALDGLDEVEYQPDKSTVPGGMKERNNEVHVLANATSINKTSFIESDLPFENLYRGLVLEVNRGIAKVQMGEETLVCSLRGSIKNRHTDFKNSVAAGDQVIISRVANGEGVLEKVLPSRGVLARTNSTPNGTEMSRRQLIAANVDQVIIVASWRQPNIWPELIDRYLITAQLYDLEAVICINKVDLIENHGIFMDAIRPYLDIGLRIISTSTITGEGIEELRASMLNKSSVLVGLSGAGKSSLLTAVQPGLSLDVRSVKVEGKNKNQGRHTTSNATMWLLNDGGAVIDTPGIRYFDLAQFPVLELALFFPEMTPYVGGCKFSDCRHDNEPGCAIRKAVVTGMISPLRYKNYMHLMEELQ